MEKIRFSTVYYLTVIIVILLPFITLFNIEVRILKYSVIIPVLFLFFFFNDGKITIKPFMYPFILLLSVFILNIFHYSVNGFIQFIIILSALIIFFLPQTNNVKLNIRLINIAVIILFVIILIPQLDLNLSYYAFVRSETSTSEHTFISFYFGIFTLYFIQEKKYGWALCNLIFLILAMKRIVIVGLLSALIISVLFGRKVTKYKYVFIIVNFAYLYFFYLLTTGMFDDLIFQYTGLSVGHFTKGRTGIFKTLQIFSDENFLPIFIHGIGFGQASNLVAQSIGYPDNLHNDILKIYAEFGFIVLMLFLYLFYSIKNTKALIMAFMFNVFLFTSNVLIYSPVLMLFYAIQNNYNIEEKLSIMKGNKT